MRPSHMIAYPAAGEIIDGKYQIVQMLGEGGMGAVAKANHMLRRAPVALKFMAPHVLTIPGAVERFLNEAVAASQIENQHVVTIFDVGKLPHGAPYLVMEYLDGRDLAHLIETEGQRGIDVPRAVHFVLQILRALQSAHAAGIIHRDLKPSNAFIIKKDGERDFVKLVDFGISKVQQPGAASLTQTNSALGTPLYMSPEQAKSPRDVDLRSDIYSVACLLYELLTGRTPHNSESGELTEILFKLFTQDPTPIRDLRPDLPEGLAEVVHKGLARERDVRYANALEFAEGLAPFADERSAQVLSRLRAPVERRTEPPVPMGSMPVPMASLQAFSQLNSHFSQLNSQQFPHPQTPVSITPAANPGAPDFRAHPSEVAARTQALPSAPPRPHDPNLAVAGTQSSSQTGMGVVSDADKPKRSGKAPRFIFVLAVVTVFAGVGVVVVGKFRAPAAGSLNADSPIPSARASAIGTISTPPPVFAAVPTASSTLPETATKPDAGPPSASSSGTRPKPPTMGSPTETGTQFPGIHTKKKPDL